MSEGSHLAAYTRVFTIPTSNTVMPLFAERCSQSAPAVRDQGSAFHLPRMSRRRARVSAAGRHWCHARCGHLRSASRDQPTRGLPYVMGHEHRHVAVLTPQPFGKRLHLGSHQRIKRAPRIVNYRASNGAAIARLLRHLRRGGSVCCRRTVTVGPLTAGNEAAFAAIAPETLRLAVWPNQTPGELPPSIPGHERSRGCAITDRRVW